MNDIQDQLTEIYEQFVELNDIIEENISKAIQYVIYCVM